jgi:hypothetical protein
MVVAPYGGAQSPVTSYFIGTIGIAAGVLGRRLAFIPGKARLYAAHFMQLAILFCPLMALGGGHSGGGGRINGEWSSMFFGGMLAVESEAVLIWLSARSKRSIAGSVEAVRRDR